jgi:predicted DNA-binding transcriptional regulator AlpA
VNKPLRLIPVPEGLRRLHKSKSKYYVDRKRDPYLPQLVKPNGPGTRASAFVESEVDEYIERRMAERSVAGGQR